MASSTTRFLQITTTHSKTQFTTKPRSPILNYNLNNTTFSNIKPTLKRSKPHITMASSSSSITAQPANPLEPELGTDTKDEKFNWYSQWYPVMPVCDLDKRRPHAKRVMGLDVVVWWDRNENEWKVFDDTCPHRLAPLSEGRIDKWGRLQCVYHGWCFDGSGDCKLIPQAPPDGPPVHTFKKACVVAYPTTVQHDIVWFWPNSDPEYKDIFLKKKPPYISELDDPSFSRLTGNRDIPYGYEVLIENLVDPAHVPYAHYGIMPSRKPTVKVDREGGSPLEINVKKLYVDGFLAKQEWTDGFLAKQEWGTAKFLPPCILYVNPDPLPDPDDGSVSPDEGKMEKKIMDIGSSNWQKACFVPTKSDALVVAFRRWLNKYGGGQVDWKGKYSGALPPSPPKEQLMDRYWSHVVNCSSCSTAYKGLNAVEVTLQVISLAAVGVVAVLKQNAMSAATRNSVVVMALVCFATSRWLAHFIYKNFRYHDYDHAIR